MELIDPSDSSAFFFFFLSTFGIFIMLKCEYNVIVFTFKV